MYKHTSSTECR